MAEQRHRTTLEYRVDDRQIKGLDQTLHRAFDERLFANFERMLERSAKQLENMTKVAERFETTMRRSGGGAGGGGGGGGGGAPSAPSGGGGGGGNGQLAQSMAQLARAIQQLQTQQRSAPSAARTGAAAAFGGYFGGLASHAGGGGEGIIGGAMSGIPVVGGFLNSAVSGVQRYYQEYAQAQMAIAGSVGTLGSRTLQRPGQYTRFGMSQPQAFGQAAQYASSAGLTGSDFTGDIAQRALEMQHLGGISDPTAIIGAQGIGGGMGGRSGVQVMTQAISAGMVAGVREARLGQFIATATGVLEQGRIEGTDLSAESVAQLMQGFGMLVGPSGGFGGERGQRAMGSAVGAMRGFQPGMDVSSLVGLRAAGFGTPGGPSYHEALRAYQEHPERVLPSLVSQVRAMGGGNRDAQVELMRQILPRFLGFTPSIQQAEDLVDGDLSGFTQSVGTGAGEQFLEQRQQSVGGAYGVPAREAGYQNQRIAVGGSASVQQAAVHVRNIEMAITQTILPRVANGIEAILGFLEESYGTFQEQVMGNGRQGGVGWSHPIDMLREGLDDILEMLPEAPTSTEGSAQDMDAAFRGGDAPPTDRYGRPRMTDRYGRQRSVDTPPNGTTYDTGGAGPHASAADALRRISSDAAFAADALDRAGATPDGALAMG